MSVSEIRRQLHKAIDEIENKELLQAMLTILAQNKYQSKEYHLTEDQLNILHEREGEYLKGKGKTKTLEEFKAKMKKKHGL